MYIYAVPGELFLELAFDIVAARPGAHAMIAEVANGNGAYFPTTRTYEENPDVLGKHKYGCEYTPAPIRPLMPSSSRGAIIPSRTTTTNR